MSSHTNANYDAIPHTGAPALPSPSLPPRPLLEVCIDSVASGLIACAGGAARVELCCSLIEGGLTPSFGLIRAARHRLNIPIMVLIRPRAGDFAYTDDEFDIMRSDIRMCKDLGCAGVVFGILSPDGRIDDERTRELVEIARPMAVTFHRAIDMTTDIEQAATTVMEMGIERILTSGGCADAIQGAETIKSLVRLCGARCVIVGGGGLTAANLPSFVAATGCSEVHGSMRGEWKFGRMEFKKAGVYMGGEKRNDGLTCEYATKEADEEKIRQVTGKKE